MILYGLYNYDDFNKYQNNYLNNKVFKTILSYFAAHGYT